MTELEVGEGNATRVEIDEIVGRHVPQRVVDNKVELANIDDAAGFVRTVSAFNHGFVMVFLILVVPCDAGGNGVVGHFCGEKEVVDTYPHRIGRRYACVGHIVDRQDAEKGATRIEALHFKIADGDIANLHLLASCRQVELTSARSESSVQ